MAGGDPSVPSFAMLAIWVAAVVVLGIVLAYGAARAGRLRRVERERLDQRTRANFAAEQRSAATDISDRNTTGHRRSQFRFALMLPFIVVCFAIVWMIWSMAHTNAPLTKSTTTGTAQQSPEGVRR